MNFTWSETPKTDLLATTRPFEPLHEKNSLTLPHNYPLCDTCQFTSQLLYVKLTMSSLFYSVMDQINLKPLHSTKTIKISSRTSVQSEPIITSDGDPALKYKPVILYPEKDNKHESGVFSLEDDRKPTKHDLGPVEDDQETLRDKYAGDRCAAARKEDFNKAEVNEVPDKGEDKIGRQNDEGAKGKDINEFLVEPKTQFRWRGLSPVQGESITTGKGKGTECGFCEQEQVNPKLLPCFHSFCKECIEKLIYVRNG